MKYINVPIFIASLVIGLLLNYLIEPPSKKINVYPTTTNYDNIQYKDSANNCFGFNKKEVLCPKKEKISMIPFQ